MKCGAETKTVFQVDQLRCVACFGGAGEEGYRRQYTAGVPAVGAMKLGGQRGSKRRADGMAADPSGALTER